MLSLRKTKDVYFWSHVCVWASNSSATGCAYAFFVSEVLVVPQPISIPILTSWPVVAFGSIPALMHHFLARGLPFSIISNHYAEARIWKPAPWWWISSKFRSLWYNRNDWLGIKHQVTYFLAYFLLIVIYVCCDHITCCVFPGAQILVSWGRWTPWGKCLHALWGSHMFFILLSIMLGIFNVSKAHPKLDYISFIS